MGLLGHTARKCQSWNPGLSACLPGPTHCSYQGTMAPRPQSHLAPPPIPHLDLLPPRQIALLPTLPQQLYLFLASRPLLLSTPSLLSGY